MVVMKTLIYGVRVRKQDEDSGAFPVAMLLLFRRRSRDDDVP
jgi:hypothetical protein